MKRLLTLTVIFCMLICSVSAFAVAEKITLNGETLTIPEDMGKICEIDDRTFVPVRFVVEHLGCHVNYNEAQQGAAITDIATGIAYYVQAGSDVIFVINPQNATPVMMDTEAFINNDEGRMYVPIRFLATAMGYQVDWDEATQTVALSLAE